MPAIHIPADQVMKTLSQHILVDGFHVVMDLRKSHGNYIHDALSGKEYLDFYSYFASLPIGHNHPKLVGDADFLKSLELAALANPANADIYTPEYAAFVNIFAEVAKPATYRYLFFVAGGSLAVENALKTAFDWKVRYNQAHGRPDGGSKIMHFRQAFHGRSGYCLSLTNTDPGKVLHFPKFDWPRVDNPHLTFPLTDERVAATIEAEKRTIAQMEEVFRKEEHEIAAIIIEPIQGEGGDHHFRPEFMQTLRRMADEHHCLLIFDEVQTGFGITGRFWAQEHHGVTPDITCFGKKSQVCGIMVTPRVDEVEKNVFKVSSRINSTWGGNLVDMVRCAKYLEIIRDEQLVENAATVGAHFGARIDDLASAFPQLVKNARGAGLMRAFTLPTPELRNTLRSQCWTDGLATLAGGTRTIRFRPCLNVTSAEIDCAIDIMEGALKKLPAEAVPATVHA
ncbi:MAG: L-lysine 6-transaminase [Planctomycetota bacterium]